MGQPRQAAQSPITVCVVEDNAEYRSAIRTLLDGEDGFECHGAFGSAEELLDHLAGHFAPDVVLLDIGLPGMDGIKAVGRIGLAARSTAVIMLTVHEDNDRIFAALCAGASGYLSKTAAKDEIIEAVRDVKRGGASMSPHIARRVLNIFAHLHAPRADYGLTERERQVLDELVAAKSKKKIAKDLDLSVHTVDTHVRSIYAKLHVSTQAGAVAKALKERLIH